MALPKTFRPVMSQGGESGHRRLGPDVSDRALSSPPFTVMLGVGLAYTAVIILKFILLYPISFRLFF